MKITKSQLIEVIKEEIQSEARTQLEGQRAAEVFRQIEEHMKVAKGIRAPMEVWAPDTLDEIEKMLRMRKAVPKGK